MRRKKTEDGNQEKVRGSEMNEMNVKEEHSDCITISQKEKKVRPRPKW